MSPSSAVQADLTLDEEGENLAALIGRVAESDRAAFASLYQATSPRLFGLALRILRDRTLAEEVLLDVYTQIWQTAGSYRPERASPWVWIILMARSRAIDVLRSRATRAMIHSQPTDSLEALPDFAPGPEENTEASKRQRMISAALAKLMPAQREPIELAFFSGLTHSEIAAQLNKPVGTVKTPIRLGMNRLRDLLGMDNFEWTK